MRPTTAVTTAVRNRRLELVLIVGLALTGFTMRIAVTSVGAVLDDLQSGLHASGTTAGVVTTLPVICFAVLGSLAPRVARAVGPHRLLVISLLISTVGLLARAVVGSAVPFVLLSVLALVGGAVSNVLLPSLVKAHFPLRIGAMTALYTTALAIGSTAGAGLTVPAGDVAGGWRGGLAVWSLFTLVAAVPWVIALRSRTSGDDALDDDGDGGRLGPPRTTVATLARSRTAWALTLFFGAQSAQAYIALGWFARFLDAHGISSATAGAMVAVYAALGIPVSVVVPRVPPARQRLLLVVLTACNVVAYAGLAIAPVGGAWAWMVLAGTGAGTFPLSLTLVGHRTRTATSTASLSAFTQSIGYVLAGAGPLLFGALFGATGSWTGPLVVLFVALALSLVAGWRSIVPIFVDDEVHASV